MQRDGNQGRSHNKTTLPSFIHPPEQSSTNRLPPRQIPLPDQPLNLLLHITKDPNRLAELPLALPGIRPRKRQPPLTLVLDQLLQPHRVAIGARNRRRRAHRARTRPPRGGSRLQLRQQRRADGDMLHRAGQPHHLLDTRKRRSHDLRLGLQVEGAERRLGFGRRSGGFVAVALGGAAEEGGAVLVGVCVSGVEVDAQLVDVGGHVAAAGVDGEGDLLHAEDDGGQGRDGVPVFEQTARL